jgi:hypothetical protein
MTKIRPPPVPQGHQPKADLSRGAPLDRTIGIGHSSFFSHNDSVKKNFNHRWTQINTDEEMSERRSGPEFRRSLNDALYVVLEDHVFYPCPSVSICG